MHGGSLHQEEEDLAETLEDSMPRGKKSLMAGDTKKKPLAALLSVLQISVKPIPEKGGEARREGGAREPKTEG